jgi:4-amino-4-deoxy-L-arabinose transferase-like glycosyltransferase
VPRAAWLCAFVACLNAACWSLIVPPFQTPDEPSHFAYVQLLAESGQLPSGGLDSGSPEENLVVSDLRVERTIFGPFQPISSEAQQRKLERDMASGVSREGAGGAGPASSEPPLFYALETIPYGIASGGSLLDQLELMRLLSALFAGITAMFAYLFVREVLPGSSLAWTVGGLAVALFPLLGMMSGAVNPDALLFAVSAALYYCLARGFRRGLTSRLALATGILTAAGFLTKLNFIGFAPGVLLGLGLLAVRARTRPGSSKQTSLRAAYGSFAIALSPILFDLVFRQLSNHSGFGSASASVAATGHSLFHEASYMWQLFMPRLPGMPTYFPGIFTTRELWFNGLVGLYGWGVIPFPSWVYDLALLLAGSISILATRELVRRRGPLRRRIPELVVYCLPAIGILTMVAAQSYLAGVVENREVFWQPRYLLPMLPLWGLIATLAARGAGKRWGPVIGVLLVAAFLAHDVVSQLQVVARFYG